MRDLPDEFYEFDSYIAALQYWKRIRETHELQAQYIEDQAACIAESVRLLAPNGSICWQVGNHVDNGEVFPLDILLYPLFKNHGLQLRNRIVWTFGTDYTAKNGFLGDMKPFCGLPSLMTMSSTLILCASHRNIQTRSTSKAQIKVNYQAIRLGKNPSDVWDIPNVKSNHVEKTDHPCQFPVGLVERLVLALTNEGGSVLDPYLGVGSSAVAAVKHGRHAFGCDLDKGYIDIAWERIHELRAGTLRTRPMNKPVYDPNAK